jgi:hypothetical protein
METKAYPPTARFRELSAEEKAARLDASADLLNLLQFWRGDPRLNSWEEGFLTGMVRLLQIYEGKAKISPKQWDKMHQIFDRMTEEMTEQEED